MKQTDTTSCFYRLSTIYKSFKALYSLSPEQVNSFMNSYNVYNYNWVDGKAFDGTKEMKYEEVKQKLIDWYSVLNHLCAIGEVEKMYIPPNLDKTKGLLANQLLFEERMAKQLEMKAGQKALEIGCGKGRIASHLASLTNASVTGINIDQGQLDDANEFAQRNGLSEKCQFLNRDMNDLPYPFPDSSFDIVYEVQAITNCRDLPTLFKELHRLLKPGGKISILDWAQLPNYNPNDPDHARLMKTLKPVVGAIGTNTPKEFEDFLQQAGFEILLSERAGKYSSLNPINGNAHNYFTTVGHLIRFLVKVRIFPKHFALLFDRFTKDGQVLIEAENKELMTTHYHIIARKK